MNINIVCFSDAIREEAHVFQTIGEAVEKGIEIMRRFSTRRIDKIFKLVLAVEEANWSMVEGRYIPKSEWKEWQWLKYWHSIVDWAFLGTHSDIPLLAIDQELMEDTTLFIHQHNTKPILFHVALIINTKSKKGNWITDVDERTIFYGDFQAALEQAEKLEKSLSRHFYSRRSFDRAIANIFIWENEGFPKLAPKYSKPIYNKRYTL